MCKWLKLCTCVSSAFFYEGGVKVIEFVKCRMYFGLCWTLESCSAFFTREESRLSNLLNAECILGFVGHWKVAWVLEKSCKIVSARK